MSRYLVASGNSNNPAIYDGGTLPASNAVLRLNGFILTVVANMTLAELRCDALAPAVATTAARSLLIANGVTLTCTTLLQGITGGSEGLIACSTGGATGNIISPLFQRSVSGPRATETLNFTGTLNTTGGTTGCIRGQGTTNWTGLITNPEGYIWDTIAGGTLNIVGNVIQNGGVGIWARGQHTLSVVGNITNAAIVFYDNTDTSFNTFQHNGSLIAGTAPVVRSRSPYYGSGPFVNNGEVMALSADKVRIIGTTAQWTMAKTDLVPIILYAPGTASGFPAESDVADGTVYGPTNNFTGTLEPWDATFAQALATAQSNLQLPAILGAITS
jgi:hypothetical protein